MRHEAVDADKSVNKRKNDNLHAVIQFCLSSYAGKTVADCADAVIQMSCYFFV